MTDLDPTENVLEEALNLGGEDLFVSDIADQVDHGTVFNYSLKFRNLEKSRSLSKKYIHNYILSR